MEENKKPKFGTAVNTSKKPGEEGAAKLKEFMLNKYGKDPETMTKADKKAFRKMAKELLKAKQIDTEEYNKILSALG